MIGRKGLFGRGVPAMPGVISGYGGGTFDMDGMPVTMPDMQNIPTTAGGRFGNPMPAQMQEPARPKSFWQGGDKFTVRDGIAGALAAIGDGLSGWAGGGVGAVGGLLQGRMEPQRLAEEQRRRAAELADFRTQMQIRAEFDRPDAPKPGSFEWFQTATPEQVAQYNSYMDITNPVMTTTWQGPTVIPRRPPVGAKINMSDLGAEAQPPAAPQRPQIAAPITGARRISQADYQRILRGFGGDQRRMNAYMTEQNILVGN